MQAGCLIEVSRACRVLLYRASIESIMSSLQLYVLGEARASSMEEACV
jgi:hypothetical protein